MGLILVCVYFMLMMSHSDRKCRIPHMSKIQAVQPRPRLQTNTADERMAIRRRQVRASLRVSHIFIELVHNRYHRTIIRGRWLSLCYRYKLTNLSPSIVLPLSSPSSEDDSTVSKVTTIANKQTVCFWRLTFRVLPLACSQKYSGGPVWSNQTHDVWMSQ